MSQHQWFYLAPSTNDPTGPVPESQLFELAKQGTVRIDSKVASPTRTQNQWTDVNRIQGLVDAIQQGEAARQQQAAQVAAEKEARKAQQHAESQARKAANTPEAKVRSQVKAILLDNETIDMIVVQGRLTAMSVKPDAIVATNRRLIVFRSKLTGYDFTDMLWLDLHDAQIKTGLLGAAFDIKHISGNVTAIDNLPKDQATQLYRIAQQREEEAREWRRQRAMEEKQAGATQISVGTQAPAAPAAAAPAPTDPMQRLVKLKSMLDAGLILQEDFDKRKAEILSEI